MGDAVSVINIFDWLAAAVAASASVGGAFALYIASKQLRQSLHNAAGGNGAVNITPQRAVSGQVVTLNPNVPAFEKQALEAYYGQALSAARVSFWFSLGFASIGFAVIIFAFISHTPGDATGTGIKVVSGGIIDAVAGLFFVQSTAAQKSMGEFFDKLRLDRLHVEARELVDQVENSERRDQLRAQLVLKYAGINQLLEGGR